MTVISAQKDSLQSLEQLKQIKNLDFSDFKEIQFAAENRKVKYRLLSPKANSNTKKYPLILVFHGSGAVGSDNYAQMGVLAKMWLSKQNRAEHQVFVLAPQFPARSSNYHLDLQRKVQVSESNIYLDEVLKNVEELTKTNNIDPDRIYVMGFSMGGATVSNAISKRPDLFAAAINISGVSQFDKIENLKKLPIWIVHGGLDTDNKPESNIAFYKELQDHRNVFFWNYKDKYHNNILSSELIEAIPKWLFKQKKQIYEQ